MNNRKIGPVVLKPLTPRSNPWLYALVGSLVGFTFELAVCVPLDTIITYLWECFYSGNVCKVENIFEILKARKWFPGDLIVGILYGIPLGLLYWRVKVNRQRIDVLHHEFELWVATLRHHYKNLAIGIHGFSSRIKRKIAAIPECEDMKPDAEVMEEAAQRLTHTLGEEPLFLKALTSDTLTPVPADFYPVLVHAVRDLKSLRFQDREIAVEINGRPLEEPREPLVFPFENNTMVVILQNVLSNAMKYGDRIGIEVRDNRDWVKVSVRDNGPGLEVGKLRQILLSPPDRAESTRLGVKVSLHLLEKCGGRLSVWSEPGAGAEFIMEFPKSPAGAH